MVDYWLMPWRTSLAFTAAALDTALALQKSYISIAQLSRDGDFDGQRLREAFQLAADANIRRWAETAGMLQGLPAWYREAAKGPGGTLTDLFDRAQRRARR